MNESKLVSQKQTLSSCHKKEEEGGSIMVSVIVRIVRIEGIEGKAKPKEAF